MRAALLRLDASFGEDSLPIVIGETGWPTAGHPSASAANAATYMRNMVTAAIASLASRALRCFGAACFRDALSMVLRATQVKLGLPLFLFEAFDETNKVQDGGAGSIGAVVENNWGMFTENGTLK